MSSATAADERFAPPKEAKLQASLFDRAGPVILVGFLLSFALSWSRLAEVWQRGTFFDTDDAMRLVQVRDWLAGQGWFDLTAHRLGPPGGLLMHWSRVVDVPVGGLIRLFEWFTSVDKAEKLARIVFPLTLQLCLLAITVGVGRLLAGTRAILPAMILLVLSGFQFEQFPPGRIDHHAPQITLLMGMIGTILASLSRSRGRHAMLTGLLVAVSLAISLENLPFLAVIVAILPLVWVVHPAMARSPMLWLGLGLAIFVPALFVATVPPSRYLDGTCDAFSVAHLIGVAAGAAGLATLAALSDRLATPLRRAAALGLVGAAVGGCVLATFPACVHDPYATMDPLLRSLWLSHVTEAQSMVLAASERPDTLTTLLYPLLVGAFGCLVAIAYETGLARIRWMAIFALTVAGIAGSLWEIRVSASAQPVALLGGVWIVTKAIAVAQRRHSAARGLLAALLVLPFSTVAWAFVPARPDDKAAVSARQATAACREPDAFAPMASLQPGRVFAPIDDGSHLLAHTAFSVVAAPYHRNQIGNKAALEGFLTPPSAAEAIVRGSGARYVAFCPGETEISLLDRRAPEGLAHRLLSGEVPSWLEPVTVRGTPYRLFRVR